ncbi:hypothetical protein AgCh_024882 [Apium graveolens]
MDTLKRHLPFSGQEGLQELEKIAVRFEEKIYTAATSQSDYLRKISLKMLTMETKNPMPNAMQSNSSNNGQNPPDPGSQNMQSQLNSQGPPLPVPVQTNLSQSGQLLPQNIANNISSAGMQGSASLTSSLPMVSNLSQNNIPNVVNQNNNMQSIPNISGVVQNSVASSIGQGVSSNMFGNSQRQMQPGRQQGVPQQQQQPQTSQQSLYQQHLKQKYQSGAISHSQMQSHLQQLQQQQNLLQSNQLHSSQQSVMQPSMMQSSPLSSLQQNQQSTQSVLQQHPQSLRQRQQQASNIHQQQTTLQQQAVLPTQQQQQQQQHLVGQSNATNIQQNQLIGQQNSISDMQQQQRMLGQQNNLSNQQQQLMGLPNNLPHMHQQQIGPQGSVGGLQQQQQQHHQVLGAQTGTSVMPNNQHSVHMLQQSKVPLQQSQQSISNLLPSQGQQSQQQSQQQMMSNLLPNQNQSQQQSQQMMSQIQSQPGQLHKPLGLQQQPNQLNRDMQQRLQTPATLLQQQNVIDQKQVFQPQRAMPEAPSTSQDSTNGDWQEEIYQKIKAMKDMYYLDLNDMYQKIAAKLHQNESILQQQPHMQQQQGKNPQLEKLKAFKSMLERFISLLQVSKSNIQIGYKDKLGSYEKQIMSILNSNRPRKPIPPMQQGQALPPQHMHSMQQSQPPQSQMTQLQPLDNQMNPQMQSMNLPGSGGTMQQKTMASLQHNPSSPVSGLPNAQQNMINSLQPGSALDPGQSNSMNSMQQVASGSLQQNNVSGAQQANANLISSQNGMNSLQANHNPMQQTSNMLQQQQQHLKQQEQLMQNQQMKHMQQRQLQQIAMQKQMMQQQQQFQQTKLQQPAQMQSNQSPHLHQMSDSTDMKIRQQLGVKSGVFQQQHSASQRSAYQQLKPANQFHISSPQLLQPASPQISQHASPQIDQQNMLSALTKAGTPLQSANSPFIVPSPSTPSVPSPMPGESEKVNSGVSALSNAGNIGHHQTAGASVPAQSLAIGTPGISASPLLAEFTSPEGHHPVPATVASGKSNATEQPIERLLKAMKSMSADALTASVRDIGSVVSMVDRVAGSAPGNGSRAAVGEDLVAMTKCRLQARNFISQDGTTGTKKMKRYTTAMPSDVVSSTGSMNDSFKQFNGSELSDLESTATSIAKKPRNEANQALFEEMKEINSRLIDTVVDISDEDADPTAMAAAKEGGEGTMVKCSYSAVALSPNLKSQYVSSQMSPIQPLRLLVPRNYPNCSPILLDKFPVEVSKDYEDLSMKARSKFSISLRSLSQPMSIGEIAKTWDICARAVISEYAQQSGGGTFSSKYGTWEDCLTT